MTLALLAHRDSYVQFVYTLSEFGVFIFGHGHSWVWGGSAIESSRTTVVRGCCNCQASCRRMAL